MNKKRLVVIISLLIIITGGIIFLVSMPKEEKEITEAIIWRIHNICWRSL